MPRLPFSGLPVEILGAICAMLCPHCARITADDDRPAVPAHGPHAGVEALHSLCRTSRLLRTIAQPLLYHDIAPRRFAALLRTLVARPDLAADVRCISNASYQRETFDRDHVSDADAVARSVGVFIDDDETSNYYRCEVVFEMLIAYLPELEAVAYAVTDKFDPGSVIAEMATPFLSKLRYLHLSAPMGELDLESCLELITMAPNLQSLTCTNCTVVPPDLPQTRLKHLSFKLGRLNAEYLTNILEACPLLEEFAYENAGYLVDPFLDRHFDEVMPRELSQALKERKATLRHLDLDVDGGRAYDAWDDDGGMCFGSFSDFEALETLMVPPEYLGIGHGVTSGPYDLDGLVHMLPKASLRVLGMHGGLDHRLRTLDTLGVAVRDGRFPMLERLELDLANRAVYGIIVDRFKEVGVAVGRYRRGRLKGRHLELAWPF